MEILKTYQKEQLLIKFSRDKAFNIAKDPKYDAYQRGLATMVYTFFNKKLQVVVLSICHKISN